MKAKSHQSLGRYLSEKYMAQHPQRYIQAFHLGCTQPDKNPITYLKGSIRHQWLRGHNWRNAKRYMTRLSHRLERRNKLTLLDYYALGKLIHYTVDAFTWAHNDCFPSGIHDHRCYETHLQHYFLAYLQNDSQPADMAFSHVMDAIAAYHAEYAKIPANVHTDSKYCVLVTSHILCMLLV